MGDDMRQRSASPTEAPLVRHDVSLLSADDLYLFNEGSHFRLYEKLGAHSMIVDGASGTYFAVWAPAARQVAVLGDFNGWNRTSHALRPRGSSGIWEGFIGGLGKGAVYKYNVVAGSGAYTGEKADPFAVHHETPPRTASIVWDLEYAWGDGAWMEARQGKQGLVAPVSIY
ncbi:MAG: 1,4-alpha-glucan branching enzyme, partial [Dehalococcoidia bacterium]